MIFQFKAALELSNNEKQVKVMLVKSDFVNFLKENTAY